ncbi:MAG: hypothetical protein QM496_07210 [Verrucomicrobiota bacterium]
MKHLSLLFPIPSQLAWIAIISMLALSSCKTTITSSPSNLASTSTEKKRPIKKRAKKLFQKKPGDARADFQRDQKAGRLKLKQYGAPSEVTPYYNQILKDDLGIKTEVIADGVIDTALLRYAKEYNALMTMEIERKYGPGILQKAYYRARVMEQQVRQSNR